MTRGFVCFGGTVAMLVSMMGAAAEAGGAHALKASRTTAGRAELGLTVSVNAGVDGSLLLSATAGDLTFRKAVYPDGRFHAQIEQGRDRVALAGSEGRLTITY